MQLAPVLIAGLLVCPPAMADDAAIAFGDGAWTFGWRPAEGKFTPMVKRDPGTCGIEAGETRCWGKDLGLLPLPGVAINSSKEEFFEPNGNGSLTNYDLGALYLRPSPGEASIVRWTAAGNACVRVAGNVAAADRTNQGTKVRIFRGDELLQAKALTADEPLAHFRITRRFAEGETLDIEVWPAHPDAFFNSTTALRVAANEVDCED